MSIMDNFTIHPKAKAPLYRSYGTTLDNVYRDASAKKRDAYIQARKLFVACDGEEFAISGASCQMFSCMWFFTNPDNGRRMLAHITKDYNHAYYV